jgi:hypothetical protein
MATSTVTDWDEIEADPDFSSLPQESRVRMFDDWERNFNRTLLEDADLDKVKPEGLNRFAATNAVRRRKLAGEDVSDPDAAAKTWAEQKQAEAKLAQQSLKDYADVEDKAFRLDDARSMPGVDEFGRASPEWDKNVESASKNLQAAESKFTPEVREQAKAANEALKGERKIATLQGNIYTDPALVLNKDEFRQQVLDSDASPEAKALKLASFQSEKKRYLDEAANTLTKGDPQIPLAESFPKFLESKGFNLDREMVQQSEGKLDYSPIQKQRELTQEYLTKMQDRGWFRKIGSAIATGVATGMLDIGTQAVGTAAMLTGDEEKSKVAAELSRASGDIGAAQGLEGDMQATGGTFAGGVSRLGTGMAPMLLPGGAVGGIARLAGAGAGAATAAAVGASALTAGAQTAGSQFGEVYDHLRRQGSTHEQAFGVSRNAAVLSGAVTTALTALGGATGVESLLRQGGKDLVKSRLLSALKAVPGGAAAEIAEELPDEYISQLVSAFAKDPNVSPSQVTDEFAANAPDLMLQIAALGGAGAGVGRFRETTTDPAKAREAEFPTAGAPPPLKPQDYENRAAGGQPVFNEEGDVIGVAPPGATPEETAAYREEIRSAAKAAIPEVVEPIDGVDPAITKEMDARLAEGKASGLADQTLAELERQKAAQGAPAPTAEAPVAGATEGVNETTVQRDTDLFPDKTNFMGKLSQEAVLSDYQEQDGFGVAEYANPDTGVTDVYLAAFGDNDFIAYIRVYDKNGKPTNRFTSKLERRSKSPGVTKKMLSDLQSRLPEGHEYTEDVSVSTDGLKFISGQLRQGYEVALDESGNPLTQDVAVSGESLVNDLPIAVNPNGKFDNIRITDQSEFNKVRPILGKMLESFGVGLGEQNVRWENGTAFIDIPVLKKKAAETLGVTAPPAPTLETPEGAARNADMLRQAQARLAGTEQGPRIGFLQPSEVAPATEAPPITPQGTPTTATEGTVMPGGSAMERDATKPEQMTPEERFNRPILNASRPKSLPVGKSKRSTQQRLLTQFDKGFEWAKKNNTEKASISAAQKRNDLLKTRDRTGNFGTDQSADDYAFWKGASAFFEISQSNKEKENERDLSETQKKAIHADDIQTALDFQSPVSAAAVDAYGIKLPSGYVKQGELYVFSPQTTTVATPTETAAPLVEWTPTVNAPAAFTASNGQKLVGTVQSIKDGKAVVSFLWNGNENTQTVPVSQLARPVASLTEPPKYQYTQEQNTRKMGKHFPTAPGVYTNYNFRKAFASMAKDTSLSRIYRMLAKVMSKMPVFANMDLHVVADGDVRYAGEYSFSNGRSAIAVNLRQVGRGKVDALGTILHEALHHLTLAKVRDPQNAWENEIIDKLDTIRGRVLEYAQQNGLGERFDYELDTVEEFISAVFTRPDFQNFLASIPDSFAPGVAVGKFRSVLSEIFRRLAELVTGEMVAKGSTMEQAMTSVLALFETPHRAVETGKLEALNAARSGTGTAKSLADDAMDAEYMAAVESGDVAKQQSMVDAAYSDFVRNTVMLGDRFYPATFIRFGNPPTNTEGSQVASTGFDGGIREKGVSVIGAWHDTVRDKYVIPTGSEQAVAGVSDLVAQNRPVFVVSGSVVKDVGSDTEPLMEAGTVKTQKQLNYSDLIEENNPDFTLDGEQYDSGEEGTKNAYTGGKERWWKSKGMPFPSLKNITYKDGKPVPLSQRFNPKSNSTLYSLAEEPERQLEGANMGRAMEMLGASLYAKNVSGTIGKEVFQNAVDAVMKNENGKARTIWYGQPDANHFVVADTGTGMNPDIIVDKFLRAFVSGKDVGAGGGFGLAKLAFLGSPRKFRIISVGTSTDGRKVKTTLQGTGKSFLHFNEHPPRIRFQPDTDITLAPGFTMRFSYEDAQALPTGTAMEFDMDEPYNASSAISAGMEYVEGVQSSGIKKGTTDLGYGNKATGDELLREMGYSSARSDESMAATLSSSKPYTVLHSFSTPSADVDVIVREGAKIKKTRFSYVPVLNRSIFQFSTSFNLNNEVALPEGLVVNIKPKVRAGTADYPFTTNRESVTDSVKREIERFFQEAGARENAKLNAKYANAIDSAAPIPGTGKVLLDTASTLPPALLDDLTNSASVQRALGDVTKIQDAILSMLGRKFGPKFQRAKFAGLITGARAYGVHFGKPGSLEPTAIYHDIWKEMDMAQVEFAQIRSNDPEINGLSMQELDRLSYDTFLTKVAGVAFHEALHQDVNSEGEPLARELTFKAGDIVDAVVSLLNNTHTSDEIFDTINDLLNQKRRIDTYEDSQAASEFVTAQGGYDGYAMAERGQAQGSREGSGKAGARVGTAPFSPADESDASEQDYQRIMARYEGTPRIAFVKKRRYSPIVRDLLNRRKDGEDIPADVLDRAIREYFPSALVVVPKTLQDIPSQGDVERAITSNKLVSHKEAMAKGMPTAGSKITVRQDVPAMDHYGVGVVTTRTENGTFYLPATRFYDPVFKTNERGALNIGLGDSKDSVIAIQGKWSQDQSMPEDLENWTQVGFNPDRHSYYYERGTERQVVGGTEAFQIGNTVFVRNPVFKNVRTGVSYSPADESDQRESDAVLGVMMEDDRFEEGVKMYDKAKRRQLGSPPQPSANTSTPPRFTNSAQFAAAFEAAYLRGDFDYFLEALKQADRHIYVPEMKRYINASKLGDKDAAERLEWFRHAIAGTIPANVKPQTKTPPPPQPSSAGAPPVGTPPPPPAATPPPKAGVSNRPMLTLNTAAMGLITKMLGAGIRINTLLRRARGRAVINFADGSELQLSEQLFKDPVQAAKTLAHEIGHLIDALPASGFGQKLAGRIAPLGNFRKVFGDDLADWSMDGGKKMKLSKINQLIIDELVGLSKKWRGDFTYQPGTYRSLGSELYADFISAILNDPMWTAKNAPYATLGFLNALEQKPEVDQAYQLVISLVQGGSLYKALAEANRGKSTTALERLIAKSSALMRTKKVLKDAARGLYRSMFGSWLPTAIRDGGIWKSYWKRLKNMGTSGDYNWAQEEASQFAVRHITQFDNDMAKAVGIPLKLAGIDPEYLQRLQTNNRIIHERRRVGKLIEEDPAKARQLLKWMVDAGLLGKDVQDEVDATPDDGLYKKTAEVIYKLHASGEGFERALRAARRKDAPADAEKALYAFDVSGFMLNPDVFTMESAEADNADIEKTLGPDQFGELERINEGYHDLIKRTMVQAYKMGLFRQSTWDDVIVPNFGVYVPFMPIKYFTGYVKGGVGPSRVGTANDLMAPHVVGIRKMHALINRMQRQKQALLLIDVFNNMGLHNELEPVEDENFDRQKAEELVKQSKNTISYASYWDRGEYKWVKINGTDAVPLVMNSDPDDLAAVYQLLKANTRLWRMNFTIFSIAFNVANTLRNIATPSVDVGPKAGYKAAKELLSIFPQMGKWVWAKMAGRDMTSIVAASISIEHAMHKPGMPVSKELQEFYDRGILQPSPDVASLRMTQEELARSVMGALSSPELLLHGGHKAAKDLNWFDKTLKQYFYSAVDALSFLGSVSEAAPKIAAYRALKEKMVPEKITATRANGKTTVTGLNPDGTRKMVPAFTDAQATYLATLEGIPRPGVGGSDNALWEMVLLFFRIMGQSWRKHLIMATAPQTRAGFLMRHMLFQGAKFGLQAMAANGVVDYLIALGAAAAAGGDDDDIEKYKQVDWAEAVSRQSDHKLSRGGVGPLICWVLPDGSIEPPYGHKSIPADWVPIMPRLPGTEFSRELDPMSYYVTSKTIAPTIAPVNDDVFWNDYMRGLVSLNPAFDVVSDAMSIVGPTPPRDSYRGREKVEQRVWDEGYIARMLGLGEHHLRSFGIGSNPYDTPLPGAWNVLKKPGFKTLLSSDNMVGVREERRARREDDLTSSFAQNMVGEKFGTLKNTFNRLKGKATPRTDQEEEIYNILKPVMSKQFYGTQKNDGMYDVLQSYARMKAQGLQDTPGGKLLKAEADQVVKDLEQTADELQKPLEYLRTHTLP